MAYVTQPSFVHKSMKLLDKGNMDMRYFATSLQFLEALGLYRTPFASIIHGKQEVAAAVVWSKLLL